MLFQLVPTKLFQSALFSCLPKVDQVINVQKAYREMTPKRNVIRVEKKKIENWICGQKMIMSKSPVLLSYLIL